MYTSLELAVQCTCLQDVLGSLAGERAKQLREKQKSLIREIKDVPLHNQNDFSSQCDVFLMACFVEDVKKLVYMSPKAVERLTRCLTETDCFVEDVKKLVYMSPKAVERLTRCLTETDCFVEDVK